MAHTWLNVASSKRGWVASDTPEVRGSNPVTGNFFCTINYIEKTIVKKEEVGKWPNLIKSWQLRSSNLKKTKTSIGVEKDKSNRKRGWNLFLPQLPRLMSWAELRRRGRGFSCCKGQARKLNNTTKWLTGNNSINGKWLWRNWQSGRLRYQRTRVRFQSSATFIEHLFTVNCL